VSQISDHQIDIQVKCDEGNKHTSPDRFIPCIDLHAIIGSDGYEGEYTIQQVHGKSGLNRKVSFPWQTLFLNVRQYSSNVVPGY